MDTTFRVRGYITAIQILKPQTHLLDTAPTYTLSIQPENPYIYSDLEQRIYELRQENIQRMTNTFRSDGSRWRERYDCKIINHTEINIKSLHKPDLQGEFADYHKDEQFLGRFVQSVGNLYVHELGIIGLSSHILEPAYTPNNEFEPYEINQNKTQ